jgi:hypothetical protein
MKYAPPFQPTWEATGVMNDIPKRGSWESDAAPEPPKRPGMQRTASKQAIQKAQFDVKQKLSDAMDTARAAELALRELLSSWRAAKYVLLLLGLFRSSNANFMTGCNLTTTQCHSILILCLSISLH